MSETALIVIMAASLSFAAITESKIARALFIFSAVIFAAAFIIKIMEVM